MGEVHDRFRWHFPLKLPFVLRLSFGDPAPMAVWHEASLQAGCDDGGVMGAAAATAAAAAVGSAAARTGRQHGWTAAGDGLFQLVLKLQTLPPLTLYLYPPVIHQ